MKAHEKYRDQSWLVHSVIRLTAFGPKGHRFNSWPRVPTSVAGSIPGGRQPIDVYVSG